MTPRSSDAVIVGGGVIGCALAAELAARGRSVTILERAHPGSEASGAAAGMLSPQADARVRDAFFDLALASRRLYPEWTRALREETGVDPGFRVTGLLRCAYGGEEDREERSRDWQRALGLRVEERGSTELRSEVGGRLSPAIDRALFFPDEAVVDPRRLTRAVAVAAERRGVRLVTGVSAIRFDVANGVCRGVVTEEGTFRADAVVDAAGAWAAFDAPLGFSIPVQPVRGQIVEIQVPGLPLPTIVSTDEVYVVPRPDGTALLGSSVEYVGFRKEVTAEVVERLLAAAVRAVPSLRAAQFVSAWCGLRPGTPDGLPLLGRSPVPGLFFAAGHFRNGILLAPITARAVADAIEGGDRAGLAPFAPARFTESATLSSG